jgi:hypothetical protein
MKHGIAIREKKTNVLVEFMECETGNRALKILAGCRINLNHEEYKANEEEVEEKEIQEVVR